MSASETSIAEQEVPALLRPHASAAVFGVMTGPGWWGREFAHQTIVSPRELGGDQPEGDCEALDEIVEAARPRRHSMFERWGASGRGQASGGMIVWMCDPWSAADRHPDAGTMQ